MTLEQLKTQLETTGYPVAYHHFNKPQNLPFICYICTMSNNFSADGKVYAKANHIQVGLYTEIKDPLAELKVENALSSFFWQKTETFIDNEKIYQILYEIEV